MDDFVAYTSRWRMTLFLLGSVAFIAIGIWMVGLFAPPPVSRRASPAMLLFWGWITIAFSGLCAVTFARLWWNNSEQLRIGRGGIRWLRWSDQIIPWNEIEDVTEWKYKGSRSIILHLRDPSRFRGHGIVGMAGRVNRAITGGDIGISLAGTDRKFDDAVAAIATFRSH